MVTNPEQMSSLVYASTATQPLRDEELTALLAVCRENNARTHLSGMLAYRDGRFLQVIEGPTSAVRELMTTLSTDPRHTAIRIMFEEPITERQFAEWTMAFERADTGSSADLPGYRTAFDDLEREDPTATVRALQELVRWFRSRALRS